MMKIVQIVTFTIVLMLIVQSVSSACSCLAHPQECGLNEEYSECGTACEETCDTPPNQPCTLQCVQGCFCKPGFVREHEHGRCIPKCKCPPAY